MAAIVATCMSCGAMAAQQQYVEVWNPPEAGAAKRTASHAPKRTTKVVTRHAASPAEHASHVKLIKPVKHAAHLARTPPKTKIAAANKSGGKTRPVSTTLHVATSQIANQAAPTPHRQPMANASHRAATEPPIL
ncbi:hypothetical protein [Paraburkholderia sp.]|uniref:hypothetical protein n=1 Tax=Paraburkholderia sp. TaxID=1926495 RepID=UPI003D6FC817